MNNGSGAIGELQDAWGALFGTWQKTTLSWQDVVQQQFGDTHLETLAGHTSEFERALVECAEVLNQAWTQAR